MVNTDMWLPRENLFIYVPIHTPLHTNVVYTPISLTQGFQTSPRSLVPGFLGIDTSIIIFSLNLALEFVLMFSIMDRAHY